MRIIIALLDESPLDERALRQAERLAGAYGRLLLIRALPGQSRQGGSHSSVRAADAYLYLHRLAQRVVSTDRVDTHVFYGDTADAILEELFDQPADLVVMAMPAGHGFGDRASGSVAAHLLTCSRVPVCIVRPARGGFGPPFRAGRPRILVPLDGSEFAAAALPEAVKLASLLSGEIVLLQVVPFLASLPPPGAAAWDVSAVDRLEAEAWVYLRNVAEQCTREYSSVCRAAVRLGVPADAILGAIGEERAGLVMMASHAHSSWRRLLMGSVSDRVLRESLVPVVLNRPHAFPAPEPVDTVELRIARAAGS